MTSYLTLLILAVVVVSGVLVVAVPGLGLVAGAIGLAVILGLVIWAIADTDREPPRAPSADGFGPGRPDDEPE